MTKKKIPLRTIIRRLEKKADKALSDYVRAVTKARWGKCPLCMKNEVEVAFHFVRRAKKIVRWKFINVIGSCGACNYLEYREPDLYRAWFIRTYGVSAYLDLVDEAQKNFMYTAEWLQGVIDDYEQKLETLRNDPGSIYGEKESGPTLK